MVGSESHGVINDGENTTMLDSADGGDSQSVFSAESKMVKAIRTLIAILHTFSRGMGLHALMY